MSSAISALALLVGSGTGLFAQSPAFRVCADPNNLPYSNQQQQGFENDLAQMIASRFQSAVSYTWFAQRGAFFRKTFDAGVCDVVMGVPAGMENLRTTRPYYRSRMSSFPGATSIWISTRLTIPACAGFILASTFWEIAIEIFRPSRHLTSRGLVRNLVGYCIFGNLDEAILLPALLKR